MRRLRERLALRLAPWLDRDPAYDRLLEAAHRSFECASLLAPFREAVPRADFEALIAEADGDLFRLRRVTDLLWEKEREAQAEAGLRREMGLPT